MSDDDRISIVTFSDSAEVSVGANTLNDVFLTLYQIMFPLTLMTKGNRSTVLNIVEGLCTKGRTNLWDGLKTGMNVLKTSTSTPASSSAFSFRKANQTPIQSSPEPATSTTSKRFSFFSSIGFGKRKQGAPPPSDKPALVGDVKMPLSPDTKGAARLEGPNRRLPAVFILTDGMPNVEPPRGHIPMFRSFLDSWPSDSPKPMVSTFGFGYQLNSRLLDEIADLGQGMYGFIPDSGMVGTVFVHAVANLMTTWATECVLDIEVVDEGSKFPTKVEVLGCLPVTPSSWGASVQVGDLQYGQSRDIVVKLPPQCFGNYARQAVNVIARYSPHTLAVGASAPRTTRSFERSHEVEGSVLLHHQVYRLSFVSAVSKLFQNSAKTAKTPPISGSEFEQLVANHTGNPILKDHEPSTALTSDISSQVIQGLGSQNWSRWGMHYIPSLARSHQRQQCLNFKDEGLQVYGRDSTLFTSTRDRIDQTFDSLPPPKPSLKNQPVYRPGKSAPATYVPLSSMSRYHSKFAPCFAGWCLVDTGDGQNVKVADLRRGSTVRTPNGSMRVANVLRTVCPNRVMDMCSIGRLAITPWHPMNYNGSWVFPTDVCEPKSTSCNYVYSILLEPSSDPETHMICIEGSWCVTLGHGCTDPVRNHAFLGNYARVVESMSRLDGFYDESGVVDSAGVARDQVTGLVCGFEPLKLENGAEVKLRTPLCSVPCEA